MVTKRIAFRNMESTPVLKEHTEEQLKKIEEFLSHERPPLTINIVLEGHLTHAVNYVEIQITAPEYHIFVKKEGPILYKVLDEVLDAAYLMLREQKRKLVDQHKHGCVQQCVPPTNMTSDEEKVDDELEESVEEEIEEE